MQMPNTVLVTGVCAHIMNSIYHVVGFVLIVVCRYGEYDDE